MRIVVEISGGLCTSVRADGKTDEPVTVVVLDWDAALDGDGGFPPEIDADIVEVWEPDEYGGGSYQILDPGLYPVVLWPPLPTPARPGY